MKILSLLLFSFVCFACDKTSKTNPSALERSGDSLIVINNDTISLEISLHGGAITSLRYINDTLNPFTWKLELSKMPENNRKGAPYQGHFICIGRWGTPTRGELAAGVPSNGEPANNWWDIIGQEDKLKVRMRVDARLEQYTLVRDIILSDKHPCFIVDETLSNNLNSGRFSAIVQHPTIGPPFLSSRTVVNTNATYGFNQSLIDSSLSEYEYMWPTGYADSSMKKIDMTLSEYGSHYVSTHIISDEYGWITAYDPDSHIMLGYLWKSSDYPWLHLWNGILDGNLWAKGLEFGTTGLGNDYPPEKRALAVFHGIDNNLFIDADSSVSRKYVCYYLKLAADFRETLSVNYSKDTIHVKYLTAGGERDIFMNISAW